MSNILPRGHHRPQVRCPDYGVKLNLTSFQAVADALTRTLLLDVQRSNHDNSLIRSPLIEEADDRRAVHQAAGTVAVQHHCDLATALALIRARAFAEDQRAADLARRVAADLSPRGRLVVVLGRSVTAIEVASCSVVR